ncbi:5'-nucleotidase domain-containing protein 1-like [Xenia sp. Carnegie-2017]|uniref:5'-nucleotidase domain-containing protein 1-like n=1 Tax=Xenia sp. Carnegie-2017 TaxID=2897299 RepID=UPI001F0476F2|nr:5'-nucleotidase domain-containing protein 1-like [Xenia sp. Carnegie-2017]
MSFVLQDFDVLGFDIDHAFVQYKLENLFPMVYMSLCRILVEKKGYPKELLDEPFDTLADFCTRGLILDAKKGDLVKVGKSGKVLRASHGTKMMNENMLDEKYGKDRNWDPYDKFIEGMKSKGHLTRGGNYRMFENFFDMPAMLMCARLIDLENDLERDNDSYVKLWGDVLWSLVMNFDCKAFAANTGYFFPAMKAEPHKYIKKTSEKTKTWLKSLRKEGKKLFLATNSQADYSMFVLDYAFGDDWRSYVDVYISRAEKPGFFREGKDFVEVVDRKEEKIPVQNLTESGNYALGSSSKLQKYLEQLCGKEDIKILFCGDSLLSDVYPPNNFSKWQTVALLEELEYEFEDTVTENGHKEESSLEEGTKRKKQKLSNEGKMRRDILTCSSWGSLFCEKDESMDTIFGHLVSKYSSLVVASLDAISGLPIDHVFEKGLVEGTSFYPQAPHTSK